MEKAKADLKAKLQAQFDRDSEQIDHKLVDLSS